MLTDCLAWFFIWVLMGLANVSTGAHAEGVRFEFWDAVGERMDSLG